MAAGWVGAGQDVSVWGGDGFRTPLGLWPGAGTGNAWNYWVNRDTRPSGELCWQWSEARGLVILVIQRQERPGGDPGSCK